MNQERQDQIKNLNDYNETKFRSVSFNNCKIMCLKINSTSTERSAFEHIQKHFDKYQDEDERDLLQAFFNRYKIQYP